MKCRVFHSEKSGGHTSPQDYREDPTRHATLFVFIQQELTDALAPHSHRPSLLLPSPRRFSTDSAQPGATLVHGGTRSCGTTPPRPRNTRMFSREGKKKAPTPIKHHGQSGQPDHNINRKNKRRQRETRTPRRSSGCLVMPLAAVSRNSLTWARTKRKQTAASCCGRYSRIFCVSKEVRPYRQSYFSRDVQVESSRPVSSVANSYEGEVRISISVPIAHLREQVNDVAEDPCTRRAEGTGGCRVCQDWF